MVAGPHEQTDTPDLQDQELAELLSHCGAIGSNPMAREALKRSGALTICFDPAMTWEAAPTGKRGRQRDYSDAAIQTCLSMKVLFGMALNRSAGAFGSLTGPSS